MPRIARSIFVEALRGGIVCGRFTQAYTWRELYEFYRLTCPPVNTQPRCNIAPTTTIDVVVPHEAGRDLMSMRWGLIPSWWKKTTKEVPSTFNARVETVASKPMFRAAFKRGRCLIPASGYYEWQPTLSGKQPYFISAADGSALSMAGLWDRWTDIETGDRVRLCTVIVTAANLFAEREVCRSYPAKARNMRAQQPQRRMLYA